MLERMIDCYECTHSWGGLNPLVFDHGYIWVFWIYDVIYLLTAVGLTTGGSSTVHIYRQTIHTTTQWTEYTERNIHNNKYTSHTHMWYREMCAWLELQ